MEAKKGYILLATIKQFNAVCCMIASYLSLLHIPSDQQREEKKKKVFSLRRIMNNPTCSGVPSASLFKSLNRTTRVA